MKKRIRINENQLKELVEQVLNELDWKTYMSAANKRHQNALDYKRGEFDATGAERRRLEKWGKQPYGSPMNAGKYHSYLGDLRAANSEENMRSSYDLKDYAEKVFDKQHNIVPTGPQWSLKRDETPKSETKFRFENAKDYGGPSDKTTWAASLEDGTGRYDMVDGYCSYANSVDYDDIKGTGIGPNKTHIPFEGGSSAAFDIANFQSGKTQYDKNKGRWVTQESIIRNITENVIRKLRKM